MRCSLRISATVVAFATLFGYVLPESFAAEHTQDRVVSGKLALLVGCTEYPLNDSIHKLMGPANDIPMYWELLTNPDRGFNFAPHDIQALVGWPDIPDDRPTRDNIERAFETLIARAAAGTQVFIVLSGHGVQIPLMDTQNPLDPENPEPDGMDEVFLPADVGRWGPKGLAGAIRDDQIGAWLDALRQKGAHVWIIFDCCHSGSMSRDIEDVEIYRSVTPHDLGVPDVVTENAARKASAMSAGPPTLRQRSRSSDILQLPPKADAGGSVAAFFAAQAWEKAPELPRPRGAPRTRDHYYGLFSYTIIQCLQQRKTPLTYRELGDLVVAKYRADRGSRGPTPCVEGDVEFEVLGATTRPSAKIVLERRDDELVVNCGELAGVGLDSILAVHPLNQLDSDAQSLVGYVKVIAVTPFKATVEPCAFAHRPALAAEDFPDRARCVFAVRDLGDLRIRVAIAEPLGREDLNGTSLERMNKNIRAALALVPQDVRALVDTEVGEQDAEWILRVVPPSYVNAHFDMEVTEPRVMLFQGRGIKLPHASRSGQSPGPGRDRELAFGSYSATDLEPLAQDLERDFAKIFSWQNLWRVAGALNGHDEPQNDSGLVFEVRYRESRNSPAQPLTNAVLRPKQIIEYHISNDGIDDLWIAVAYLDGNFGIDVFLSTSLRAGASLKPLRAMITDQSVGVEGVVAFAVPMSDNRPDYISLLQQRPLGVSDRDVPVRQPGAETPFGLLLQVVARNAAGTRGQLLEVESNPAVIAHSWVTVADE